MSLDRQDLHSYIFCHFNQLSFAKKMKLAKFIYAYNKDYLTATREGTRVVISELDDAMMRHIHSFIMSNIMSSV